MIKIHIAHKNLQKCFAPGDLLFYLNVQPVCFKIKVDNIQHEFNFNFIYAINNYKFMRQMHAIWRKAILDKKS